MPAALTALLPFEHGPPLPGAAPLVLTAIAAAFSAEGLAVLARRDIG